MRAATGARPDVAPERPDVRVHAHAHGTHITLAIDLSGESLHRRGYRGAAGPAPLKENVAAGVLLRAGWAELAAQSAEFLDPLCGSGTLCIEAALIAADRAPGLTREYFGFLGWRATMRTVGAAAGRGRVTRPRGEATPVRVRGQDRDPPVIRGTRQRRARRRGRNGALRGGTAGRRRSARRRGIGRGAHVHQPALRRAARGPAGARAVHRELGAVLRERFPGWNAAVLTGAPALGIELGLRAHRTHTLWNGAIECRLLRIKVGPESAREPGTLGKGRAPQGQRRRAHVRQPPGEEPEAPAQLGRARGGLLLPPVRRRHARVCVRDRSVPRCEPEENWLYVQEYAAPAEIELEAVRRRRGEVLATLPEVTGVPAERIRVRTRRRTAAASSTQKVDERERFHVVMEGGLSFESTSTTTSTPGCSSTSA